MKIFKWIFLVLGFYLLYATVKAAGLETIAHNINAIKWQLLPMLWVYPVVFGFDTLGWGYSFTKDLKRVPYWDLYCIRVIGETFNNIIPWAASLGGEPIKVELLKSRHDVARADAYASVLIVHTTFWVSLNIFVIGGILAAVKTHPLPPVLQQSVMIFLVGLAFVALTLVIGLHWGIFQKVHKFGEAFKWWGPDSKEKLLRFVKLDEDIKKFYTTNRYRFFLSTFFNFLGWFAGVFETYMIANILGISVSFGEAWLLEALVQVLRIVTFFIPSSIGAQEGGIVLIFSQLGFVKEASVTFAVVRRLREMIWLGCGLLVWALMEDRPKFPGKRS